MADSRSVAAMTRSWRERRHRSLIRRSLACEAARSTSRGLASQPRYPAVTLAAPLIALPREIVGPAPPETGDPAVPSETAGRTGLRPISPDPPYIQRPERSPRFPVALDPSRSW